jgi:hypothetical protein
MRTGLPLLAEVLNRFRLQQMLLFQNLSAQTNMLDDRKHLLLW